MTTQTTTLEKVVEEKKKEYAVSDNELAQSLEAFSKKMSYNGGRAAPRNDSQEARTLRDIENYQQSLIQKVSQLKSNIEIALRASKTTSDAPAAMKELVSMIRGLKNIEDVIVENDKLLVFTGDTFCVDPRSRRKHWIGRHCVVYDIRITDMQIYNLAFTVQAYGNSRCNSPHGLSDNRPCLGNTYDLLDKIAKYKDIFGLINAAVLFLESVNTADAAGKHIVRWPYYGPDGTLYAKARADIQPPWRKPSGLAKDVVNKYWRMGMTDDQWTTWWKSIKVRDPSKQFGEEIVNDNF